MPIASGHIPSMQVPEALTVALATYDGKLAILDKGRWGGNMQLHLLSSDCTLTRDGQEM